MDKTTEIMEQVAAYGAAVEGRMIYGRDQSDDKAVLADVRAAIEAFGKERFDAGYEAGADYEPGSLTEPPRRARPMATQEAR